MDIEDIFENADLVESRPYRPQNKDSSSIYKDIQDGSFEDWWQILPSIKMLHDDVTSCNVLTAFFMAKGMEAPTEMNISGNYGKNIDHKNILEIFQKEVDIGLQLIFTKNSDDSLNQKGVYLNHDFISKDGFVKIYIYEDSTVISCCGTSNLINKIKKFSKNNLINEPALGTIYMMVAGARGLEFHSVGLAGCKLERDNYATDVLVAYDRMKSELISVNPKGRLNILDGLPGCGKSFFIRGLLEEVKGACFVVVPAHYIAALSEPSAIAALTKFRKDNNDKPIVLIAEDADQCLIKREEGQISAVSAVLNIGDGLMGAVWDIRILATTNVSWIDLDPAIKRPGRLNTATSLKALDVDQANAVFKRLTGNDSNPFTKPKLLAEIYQHANDGEWKTVEAKKENKMGFGA